MSEKKIIVFHPMQQHSYKTAEALIKGGYLYKYITTIYYNPNKFIYKILGKILNEDNKLRMKKRNKPELTPYVKTISTLYGLLYLFTSRIDKTGKMIYKMQNLLSTVTGRKVARLAVKDKVDAIIAYDTWGYGVIKELRRLKSNIPIIMDYTSLYAEEIFNIIQNDIKLNNNKDSYSKLFIKYNQKYMRLYQYEKDKANYFLSASTVTDDSLMKFGVKKYQIFRASYGVDFSRVAYNSKIQDNITFIYVGQLSYAKGVHYLTRAFEQLDSKKCKLLLIGQDFDGFSKKIKNENIEFIGLVQHSDVPIYLEKADVIITGTLFDGFCFGVLEGAAYNLPMICTDKTGIKDYIKNGFNGFCVQSNNSIEIKKVVEYLLENKSIIPKLGKNAGNVLDILTWDNYYSAVIKAIKSVVNPK